MINREVYVCVYTHIYVYISICVSMCLSIDREERGKARHRIGLKTEDD